MHTDPHTHGCVFTDTWLCIHMPLVVDTHEEFCYAVWATAQNIDKCYGPYLLNPTLPGQGQKMASFALTPYYSKQS
jgi:hypothetical protein